MPRHGLFSLVVAVAVSVFFLTLGAQAGADAVPYSDHFEDGIINTNLWVLGGAKRAWAPDAPPQYTGNWSHSHEEVVAADGHLLLRVWGPTSGMTYGAEAWVRTTYDFNDGKNYLVNFTWEAVTDGHYDMYFIQITDGYLSWENYLHWQLVPGRDPNIAEGTFDLLWHTDRRGQVFAGGELTSGLPKSTWSIEIASSGVARLFEGPDATGSLIHEGTLNPDKPWYVRLMVSDGTSAGFPAGDDSLLLYSFSAAVVPVEAWVDIQPDKFNLRSRRPFVTARIELPEGYDVGDIDVETVYLSVGDSDPVPAEFSSAKVGDHHGVPTLMVKFDREAVKGLLEPADGVEVTVGGELTDGTPFLGTDTIRVVAPGKKK